MAVLLVLVLVLVAYFLPSVVAHSRKAPDINTVVVLNLLLGWTVIGWCVALALAFRDRRAAR